MLQTEEVMIPGVSHDDLGFSGSAFSSSYPNLSPRCQRWGGSCGPRPASGPRAGGISIRFSRQPMSGGADAAEESAAGTGRTDAFTHRRVRDRSSSAARSDMETKVSDFSGRWRMKSSENFEELLKALGVNVFLRKIAVAAASSPAVEITQQGDNLSIKTSTSVRTTHVSFTVGQSFSEATVDGRPCTSFPKWETDRKISCEQTLLKGDGPKTTWTRELTNDGELRLTMTAGDVVCTRVYERE